MPGFGEASGLGSTAWKFSDTLFAALRLSLCGLISEYRPDYIRKKTEF